VGSICHAFTACRQSCPPRPRIDGTEKVRFLDPAIGTGSFFSALLDVCKAEEIEAASGVELDPLFVHAGRALWEGHGLNVVHGDFTHLEPPAERFNLVLTNPPYVRHHHLSGEDKNRLKAQLAQSLQMSISGLAGLYCYFLLHAHDWMEDGGLAVWLIPSEFMDVNYGATLRDYLSERVTLLQIHRFAQLTCNSRTRLCPPPWSSSARPLRPWATPSNSLSPDPLTAPSMKPWYPWTRCGTHGSGHSFPQLSPLGTGTCSISGTSLQSSGALLQGTTASSSWMRTG